MDGQVKTILNELKALKQQQSEVKARKVEEKLSATLSQQGSALPSKGIV